MKTKKILLEIKRKVILIPKKGSENKVTLELVSLYSGDRYDHPIWGVHRKKEQLKKCNPAIKLSENGILIIPLNEIDKFIEALKEIEKECKEEDLTLYTLKIV